jgi:hypothetical protein
VFAKLAPLNREIAEHRNSAAETVGAGTAERLAEKEQLQQRFRFVMPAN